MLWLRALLVCVQTSLMAKLCQGAIECICTTAECLSESKNYCEAEQYCYVQSMIIPLSGGDKTPRIIRGCIDDRTPLLCENRVPGVRQIDHTAWPVLHCCKDDFCNKDVIPTQSPRTEEDYYQYDEESYTEDNYENKEFDNPVKENSPESEYPSYGGQENTDSSKLAINPLYIGVPVAGACVLLGIIIFAIYVLKRQNRYLEENYRNNLRQQGCVRPLTQDGKEAMCSGCRETCPYPDCERSSNGSETRLLMKV